MLRALLSGFVVAVLATSAPRAEPVKLTIGHPVASDFLATYVAKEKGFFEKHNIDATSSRSCRRR